MTYDVTRTTFSTSVALNNQVNFAESFENSPPIKHSDFFKMTYAVQFWWNRNCLSSISMTVLEKLTVANICVFNNDYAHI